MSAIPAGLAGFAPVKKIVDYAPSGPVAKKFLQDDASFVSGLMGPLGSGKSVSCVIKLLRRAKMQAPDQHGVRKTRWAVIRNSYPELKTTTLNTWKDWCPPEMGRLTMDSPIRHHVKQGEIDMEVLFLALDRPDDVRKLLSLELTGAWVNEVREIPKEIIDALTGRVGRFPAKKDGGCTWSGIFMDTNPPDDQSWYYNAAEVVTPEGWTFYRQPGGRELDAENLQNLPDGYYSRMIHGKDPDWVKVYIDADYGFVIEGKPVYPNYRDGFHTSPTNIEVYPTLPILLAADFGLTPALAIGQNLPDGRWHINDEMTTDFCGIIRFAEQTTKYVAQWYPDNNVGGCWGDPAGNTRGQNDEKTCFEIMNEYTPWKWRPAKTNEFTIRREVVVNALNRVVDGRPGLMVSPKASMIRKGFNGGYHFKVSRSGNGEIVSDVPNKNKFSHPAEAVQYMLVGAGEYGIILNRRKRGKRAQIRVASDVNYKMF